MAKNNPESSSLEMTNKLDLVNREKGKDFYHDFAGNYGSETGQPNFVAKIDEFRKKVKEIEDSDEADDVKKFKIDKAKNEIVESALARIKIHLEHPERLSDMPPKGFKETYTAITSVLANTGEIGKYLEELKELREQFLKAFPEAGI
ncbi:MAG: hypothetical protein U5L76_05835 [Patescibacteria group bacterium]|nr:hypothetical protein [Patescibacteria group bacterium]